MRYREVCKVTLKPLRWLSNPEIITQQCSLGECKTCNRSYAGKRKTNMLFRGRDLWSNKYSLCNNVRESELVVYGGIR